MKDFRVDNPSRDSNASGISRPRVALLGFCDRTAEITAGPPVSWHRNIIGLSRARVSHVYPFILRGQNLALAIYDLEIGHEFKLAFRPISGRKGFGLSFSFSAASEGIFTEGKLSSKPLDPGTVVRGWSFVVVAIEADVAALEPDEYDVYHLAIDGEDYLGSLHLVHVPVPLFTPEDIAAIRSDPLALKHVGLTLSCKLCGDALRTYTSIERSEKREAEGWIWYEQVPERFRCKCGEQDINLTYIRTGLHGLLRRSLTPATAGTVDTVKLYERTVLEEQCRKFLKLLNARVKEEDVQKFLQSHPIFFSTFLPTKLMVKKPVLSRYVTDFVVLSLRKELLLIEIEKPDMLLMKRDGGIRADLQHALDQVRRWLQVFSDHKAAALDCFGLKLEDVARVRGVVIAGRTPKDDTLARVLRATSWQDIDVYTYDDLLKGTTEIIKRVATI